MTIGATLTGSPDDAGEKSPSSYTWGGGGAGFSGSESGGGAIPPNTVEGYGLHPRPSSGVVYAVQTGRETAIRFIHQKGSGPNLWDFVVGPTGITFTFHTSPANDKTIFVPYGSGVAFQVVSFDVRIGAIYARSPEEFYFGYYLYGTSGVEAEAWASNIFKNVWSNGAFFKSFVETLLVGDLDSPDAAAVVTGAPMYLITVLPSFINPSVSASPYFPEVPPYTTLRGFMQPNGINVLFQNGTSIGVSTIEGEAVQNHIVIIAKPEAGGELFTPTTTTTTPTAPATPPATPPTTPAAPSGGSAIFGLAAIVALLALITAASKKRRRTA